MIIYSVYVIKGNKARRIFTGDKDKCEVKKFKYGVKGKQTIVIPSNDNINLYGYML